MHSPTDYAAALQSKARDDAYVVRSMCADIAAPDWVIGFHAQQAVEKAIKSVLSQYLIEFPRTHNLTMLVELLRINSISQPPDADELAKLTPFGVALRYDDTAGEDEPPINREWTMKAVSQVLAWAESESKVGAGRTAGGWLR